MAMNPCQKTGIIAQLALPRCVFFAFSGPETRLGRNPIPGVGLKSASWGACSVGVITRRAPLLFPEKFSSKLQSSGEWPGTVARARARQAEKQRRHAATLKVRNPSDQPDWLTEQVYREKIQPLLSGVTVPVLASALGISEPYAAEIRACRYLPHPRHWLTLARLVGFE